MTEPNIVVYGTNFCGDCYRAKRILIHREVQFKWIDVSKDKAGEQFVYTDEPGHAQRAYNCLSGWLYPGRTLQCRAGSQAGCSDYAVMTHRAIR
jgi:hypothetical protein